RDAIHPRRVAVDQRRVAQDVDHARNPATGLGDQLTGFIREQVDARAGSAQPEADIFADLVPAQRLEMEIRRHALREPQELGPEQSFPELRLADQNGLQELILVYIHIREHAQAFERGLAEILRFVDDQQGAPPARALVVEEILKNLQQRRDRTLVR